MIQAVYVLELLRGASVVRGHFAQTGGAARRAASGKYRLQGRWEPVHGEGKVVAQLVQDGTVLARVVRESLSYG